MDRFIVAEITKNWQQGFPVYDLLSERFEVVINVNADRGYKLVDWKLTSVINNTIHTETIIAIFELNYKRPEDMPHEASKVKCSICEHEWIAVRPTGLEKLECPNCGNIAQFENITE